MRKHRAIGSVIAAAGVVLIQATALAASGGTKTRVIARDFQIRLLDQTPVRFDDLRGKVTIIDLWGTWCAPCRAEIPDYNALYRDYKNNPGVVFLAIARESGSEDSVRKASQRFGIEYPVAAPSGKDLKAFGKVNVYPTTVIVGPDGAVQHEFVGVIPNKMEQIRGIIARLLKAGGRPADGA